MARLVIEDGKRAGTAVLVGEATLAVGRLAKCELSIDEPQASRRHFEVLRRGGEVWVKDLGSKNGTYLNEKRIDGEARLSPGDRLRVGTTVIVFEPGEEKSGEEAALSGKLDDLLESGPIPAALALSAARDVASALERIHGEGRVHGRLTPRVIRLDESGETELDEPAKEKLARLDPSRPDAVLEARCASPEEARGLDATERSDVYALGCVLYRALAGAWPVEGDSLGPLLRAQAAPAKVPPISERCLVEAELDELLASMLEKSADARPDAKAVAAALGPLAARARKAALSTADGEPAPRPKTSAKKAEPGKRPRPAPAPSPPPEEDKETPPRPISAIEEEDEQASVGTVLSTEATPPKATPMPSPPPKPAPTPTAPPPSEAPSPSPAPDAAAPSWKAFEPKKALLVGLVIFLLFVIASETTRRALRLFVH